MSPSDRARLEGRTDREIASLKQLSHPHIVKVHALDRFPDLETGHPYLVMDFVRGDELLRWCEKNAPSPLAICALFEKLARAVHYMHQRHIFHRDLKSENVLVRGDGEPVIIDFGIARCRASFRLTRHERMVGTHYAPEYIRHRETEAYQRGEEFQWTPATDLHAVGHMLYEALTTEPPFGDNDEDRLWRAVQEALPPPPSEVNPAVPDPLDAVVLKLLAKDPLDRHHSGQDLAEELRVLAERHAQEPRWSQPLATPRFATESMPVRTPPAAAAEPNLDGIDELQDTPIARAAAAAAGELPAGGAVRAPELSAEAETSVSGSAAMPCSDAQGAGALPHVPSSVRKIRDQLRHALPERRHFSNSLIAGCIAVAVLGVAAIVLAASRRDPQRPTSLVAKVAREASSTGHSEATWVPPTIPRRSATAPPSSPSSPSLSDARAIDRELEARYGGRPTITPDGGITALPAPGGDRTEDAAGLPAPRFGNQPPKAPAVANGDAKPALPEDPPWLKRSTRLESKVLVAQKAAPAPRLGIPTGAHIPARLLTTLDSRTVGNGPVEARLSRPFVLRGEVILPAGTLAFGRAAAAEGRFVVRFERLRLPDDRELEFAACSADLRDFHGMTLGAYRCHAMEIRWRPLGCTWSPVHIPSPRIRAPSQRRGHYLALTQTTGG
jgi:type IV secretory pathway VirB10-like protein